MYTNSSVWSLPIISPLHITSTLKERIALYKKVPKRDKYSLLESYEIIKGNLSSQLQSTSNFSINTQLARGVSFIIHLLLKKTWQVLIVQSEVVERAVSFGWELGVNYLQKKYAEVWEYNVVLVFVFEG